MRESEKYLMSTGMKRGFKKGFWFAAVLTSLLWFGLFLLGSNLGIV